MTDAIKMARRFDLAKAAPDMLAALIEARRILVEDEHYQPYNPRIKQIDAAIAKATGQ